MSKITLLEYELSSSEKRFPRLNPSNFGGTVPVAFLQPVKEADSRIRRHITGHESSLRLSGVSQRFSLQLLAPALGTPVAYYVSDLWAFYVLNSVCRGK